MRIARWYYVQEPGFPPGNLFHHPALIEQMLGIGNENPGLTVGDIADLNVNVKGPVGLTGLFILASFG